MRASRTYGSMRGAPSNGRPYRNRCPADSVGDFIRRRVGSSIRRNRSIGFAEADNCPDDTAAPTVDRPQTRTKPRNRYLSRASCGTESSNPFPSSGKSANHRFRGETKGAGGLDFSAIYRLIDKPERKI